ncbi:Chorismate synthase [hydrothermal vent metagenome]|uniref:chorismate synthase n=1 Tax=hydrothermal vent metagenome TaxID=652676 RepID=A0A1W1BX79_9ZZZZ
MSGNTIGKLFTLTTAGESHGKALVGIVDGCPANLQLSELDIQPELDLRKPGTSRHTTQRRESDTVEILSGVFEGKTTGTPIALLIKNEDQRSKDYSNIANSFRPGHADWTYQEKYGIRDYRGGGRSSARETAMRVAGGAIARKYLKQQGIKIQGYLAQLGDIELKPKSFDSVYNNSFFCADDSKITELETYMDDLRKSGDSVGARINVVVSGMPTGLGEPIFDRLDADIAKAMMSINAAKGVEIGAGFASIKQKGSEHRDIHTQNGFSSNNAGGILGGISSGQDLLVSVAFKPTSSLRLAVDSLDKTGKMSEVITKGRHDPCVGIRATPIVEAMMALTLMDSFLIHKGKNGK